MMDEICVEIKDRELITIERNPIIFDKHVAEINALLPVLTSKTKPMSIDSLDAIVDNECLTLFLAMNRENKIIGMLSLVMFPLPTGIHARIEDVVVAEEYQGKGVGKVLNQRAVWLANEEGAKYVDLTSHPDRGATEFYIKLGFKQRETGVFRFKLENKNG